MLHIGDNMLHIGDNMLHVGDNMLHIGDKYTYWHNFWCDVIAGLAYTAVTLFLCLHIFYHVFDSII
jgi:hypothetical protein